MGCCDADNFDPVIPVPPALQDMQIFSYPVTGLEPDLANLVITLPTTRDDALYTVQVTMGTFTAILGEAVPVTNRTTTQFVLSLTAAAAAGDTFDFIICDPTDILDPLAGVTRDATSLKYIPQTAAEWDIVLAYAGIVSGGPVALWRMQDVGPDLADSIGAFTFLEAGAPLYQQPIAGWTSLATTLVAAGVSRFTCALAQGSTVSALVLLYGAVTTLPGATRVIAQHPNVYAECTVDPFYQANGGTLVPGTIPVDTDVHDVWIRSNVTLAAESVIGDGEVLTPVWSPDVISTIALGSTTGVGAELAFVYGAAFTAAAAELTDGQIATLRTILGW